MAYRVANRRGTHVRVLIVDDDSVSAQLTAECLMMEPGVSVQIATDGASALRAVTEVVPDTILLDIDLPDASGLDLAPKLKAHCGGHALRIIIFSGSAPDLDAKFLPDGVEAWLRNLSTSTRCWNASYTGAARCDRPGL